MTEEDIQIMLVEDDKSDAFFTFGTLKKNNLTSNVIHLTDGSQALDFIFGKGEYEGRNINNKPKVIFLDLKMPKMSGLEVLKAIKNDVRTKSIPVVIITSSKEEKDIIESYRLCVNSYVVKPVGFENFSKTIADLSFYWVFINNTPSY